MTVQQLIDELKKQPVDSQVIFYDFNEENDDEIDMPIETVWFDDEDHSVNLGIKREGVKPLG